MEVALGKALGQVSLSAISSLPLFLPSENQERGRSLSEQKEPQGASLGLSLPAVSLVLGVAHSPGSPRALALLPQLAGSDGGTGGVRLGGIGQRWGQAQARGAGSGASPCPSEELPVPVWW